MTTGNVTRYTPSGAYRNYGWPWQTGNGNLPWSSAPSLMQTSCGAMTATYGEPTPAPPYTDPYAVFSDSDEYPGSPNDAIIGDYVYRNPDIPRLTGKYVFATFGVQSGPRVYSIPTTGGVISAPDNWTTSMAIDSWPPGSFIHALGQGYKGTLYVVRVNDTTGLIANGSIYRVKQ